MQTKYKIGSNQYKKDVKETEEVSIKEWLLGLGVIGVLFAPFILERLGMIGGGF